MNKKPSVLVVVLTILGIALIGAFFGFTYTTACGFGVTCSNQLQNYAIFWMPLAFVLSYLGLRYAYTKLFLGANAPKSIIFRIVVPLFVLLVILYLLIPKILGF